MTWCRLNYAEQKKKPKKKKKPKTKTMKQKTKQKENGKTGRKLTEEDEGRKMPAFLFCIYSLIFIHLSFTLITRNLSIYSLIFIHLSFTLITRNLSIYSLIFIHLFFTLITRNLSIYSSINLSHSSLTGASIFAFLIQSCQLLKRQIQRFLAR